MSSITNKHRWTNLPTPEQLAPLNPQQLDVALNEFSYTALLLKATDAVAGALNPETMLAMIQVPGRDFAQATAELWNAICRTQHQLLDSYSPIPVFGLHEEHVVAAAKKITACQSSQQ